MLKEKLLEILETLKERESQIIRLRYGMDDGETRTFEEVGKNFNVTRERIRQMEVKAFKKFFRSKNIKNLLQYLDE